MTFCRQTEWGEILYGLGKFIYAGNKDIFLREKQVFVEISHS
jgi:hypothetical protein